ncbi:protein O-mannosyl-transferase TMTC1, partial [Leptinotarsa decemlineata]|uniref:protein O-mannosyl-transferase TMTC1 n=1 Tax=Leptinotarsa decemlineata TaxID=7539 RepID=UPI003D309157
ANYKLFGLKSTWFHLTNVLLHAIACILFTRVCLCVAHLKPPFATIAGLLFAVHPIHTEAVTGIVGRADVLAGVFFLISLLAYHGEVSGEYHTWISTIFGGLSMLSKETGITVFLLNSVYDLYLHWPSLKRALTELKWNRETLHFANRTSKIFTSLGILLALRLAILQGSLPKFSQQDNPAAFHPSVLVRFLTFCYLSAFNWWLILCPSTLSHDWQMGSIPLVYSAHDSRNFLTISFFAMICSLAIRGLLDFLYQKHPPIVLGLLILILPFLPATNLLVTVGFVVAERVLYIPSIGSVLLVVYGIQMIWENNVIHRQSLICFLVLLLTTGCLRTLTRNRDWRSREALLRAGLMMLPHNAKMHYNYANFLRDSSLPELAKSHYYTALKLWPTYASAHNNLGILLSDASEAEGHFLAAIRYSEEHVNAHFNLGQLYRKNNKSSESEEMLMKCIRLDPKFTPAYVELTKLRGPDDQKINELLRNAIDVNPSDPYFGTNLGKWLTRLGSYHKALHYFWETLKMSPSHQEAVAGAAKLLRKFGQKSRLFQLQTRWQTIRRGRIGELPQTTHILYLHEWHLKIELRTRAKLYDNKFLLQKRNEPVDHELDSNGTSTSGKWSATHPNAETEKISNLEQPKTERTVQKLDPTPLMVHRSLDSA